MRTPWTVARLTALALATGALACGGSSGGGTAATVTGPRGTPNPSSASVAATPQLAFTPGDVTIAPGGTVTWTFGDTTHSVAFDRSSTTGRDPNGYYTGDTDVAPGDIEPAHTTSVARTFASSGTFTYHCLIHSGMSGTVTVR